MTATDTLGNVASASVSVTVSNSVGTGPSTLAVSITTPAACATIPSSTTNVNIAASVTDNLSIKQVSFYVDNVLKCTDTASPYTCNWNTKKSGAGSHSIKVTACDTSTSVSTSETSRSNRIAGAVGRYPATGQV